MELRVTPGKGDVTFLAMSEGGQPVTTIVIDPKNRTAPEDLSAWVENNGGSAPLKDDKADGDGAGVAGVPGAR